MSRERIYDPTEGEFVDFETLAEWEERDNAKDARIEALERQVKAADALAEEMTRLMRRTPFVPAPNGITLTITLDQIADQKAALFAYRATKEGGAP